MAGSRNPKHDEPFIGTWLQSLPAPEVTEGGESTWELWNEAARELDQAFGPTVPSAQAPLSVEARSEPEPKRGPPGRLSADDLMVRARFNNRVCPRAEAWRQLYLELGGVDRADLPPPPTDRWLWTKLSALQKRLFFREYLEWAERHGKLAIVAGFMQKLSEPDWLHMGED